MTSIISTEIQSLGTVPVQAEVTAQAILAEFAAALSPLIDVFNIPNGTDPTAADFVNVVAGINALTELAQNGRFIDGRQQFITLEMAQSINLIRRSLVSVGFDPSIPLPADQIVVLQRWRDLRDIGLRDLFNDAVDTLDTNRTLQALIQTEYVRAGNDQIFNALSELETAQSATRDALQLLEQLQDIKNMVTPDTPLTDGERALVARWETGAGGNPPGAVFTTPDAAVEAFRNQLDPIFDNPITILEEGAVSIAFVDEYDQIRSDLEELIDTLDQINETFPGGANEANRAGTLAERLDTILVDMGNSGNTTTDIITWVIDNLNIANDPRAGDFQRNLTEAIATAESINDQQRQELRRQLFLFEEFYRSASAILIAINRIVERMASNVSR